MSDLAEKLERTTQSAGKPRATEEQIKRMSGTVTVPDDARDGRGRAMAIERRRWLQDGTLGPVERWVRVDRELFERE